MGRLNYHWGQFNFWNKFFNSVSLFYVIVIIIIIFWPSVDMFPREFKNWDIQNWVQIYQSVQSGVGKLSCNKTALKRYTSTETLWNRKAPSLSSPEDEEIFLPKLPKSWHADVFRGPKVSTAIGAKRYWLPMLAVSNYYYYYYARSTHSFTRFLRKCTTTAVSDA